MKRNKLEPREGWETRDISVNMDHRLPFWPGSPGLHLQWVKTLDKGDGCNASVLLCDVHAGTHVDAPLHHLAQGPDVASLDLEAFCGPTLVARISSDGLLGPAELEGAGIPSDCRRLLLQTSNSRLWSERQGEFVSDYVALCEAGALWIVDRGIILIGVDYLSVQPYLREPGVHAILFEGGTAVLEGLDLSGIEPGWWELICLPLRLTGAEGCPARAILRRPKVEETS
jgi:arylformamidase